MSKIRLRTMIEERLEADENNRNSDITLMIEAGELDEYDQILINAPRRQSQKHVAHVHLLKFKDKREENSL